MMDISNIISQLRLSSQAIKNLVDGISPVQARWKPSVQEWSIVEVICHLADEEVEDFRTHLDHLLYHTDLPWPEIDPQSWVTQHNYNLQDANVVLLRFISERRASLIWLSELTKVDWDCGIEAPFGKLKAGDVICSWAAHDLLHLRQLIELHYAFTTSRSQPYQVQYAGEW